MIVIPDSIWSHMLSEFSHIQRDVERVAFLDGVPVGAGGVVTTLTLPNARLERRYYTISAEDMSQAGKHLRAHRLVRLAQVHTHPDDWTDHSPYDDKRAYSQEIDAVSIVLPFHGRLMPGLTDDVGVHIREIEGWRRLEPSEVGQRVRIVPSFLDFRALRPESENDREWDREIT